MDISTALPSALQTGAVVIELAGRPGRPVAWLTPDGRMYPYVAGGAEGENDEGDKGGENKDNVVTMSQADFERLISKKIGQARKGWEKEITDAAEAAKLDDAGQARKERDDAQTAADQKVTGANQRLVTAEAKVVALDLKVDPKRVDRLVRLAGLEVADLVDDDGEVDSAEVKRALEAVLTEYPEFKGTGSVGASSTDHNSSGGDGKKQSWTRAEIAAMSPAEFAKNEDSIMQAMRAGTITD